MAEFTIEEAQQQAIKAGTYFAKVLERESKDYLATRVNGVTVVIAMGAAGKTLERALTEGNLLAEDTVIHRPPEGQPAQEPIPARDDPKTESQQTVVLFPAYHAPGDDSHGREGHVHLHVLSDVKLGRRVRKNGECLCSKKRGSHEQSADGHTQMCAECVKVAEENGLTWSLT